MIGCFWGDCSLSNVLYRYDASEIRTIMVDAETSKMVPALSDGQRYEDLEIMEMNVAGGMSDIAASQGSDLDHADIHLGAQIRERYEWLWNAVNRDVVIAPDERWRVVERINELNDLGFTVDELELDEVDDGSLVRLHTTVGTRRFHADRLSELTAVQATEWQARHILSDLYHYRSLHQADKPGVSALRWRVDVLEPMLQRMGADRPGYDPIQQYCDFLHFRYEVSRQRGLDIDNEAAYVEWADQGYPGFPLEDTAD